MLFCYVCQVLSDLFEVVKEGWIFNSGLVVFPPNSASLILGYSGRFRDILQGL